MQYFDPKQYGKRIKKIREKRNMTQEQLAAAVGYAEARGIQKLEAGERVGSVDKLHDIGKVLNISTDYLLYGEDTVATIQDDAIADLLEDKNSMEKEYAFQMLKVMFENKKLLVSQYTL